MVRIFLKLRHIDEACFYAVSGYRQWKDYKRPINLHLIKDSRTGEYHTHYFNCEQDE